MSELAIPSLTDEQRRNTLVVSGEANPKLAEGIADLLGTDLSVHNSDWHSSGDPYVRINGEHSNLEGMLIIAVQAQATTKDHSSGDMMLQQVGHVSSAFNREKPAARAIAVVSWMFGARSDKPDSEEAIFAKTSPALLKSAGASEIVTVAHHNPSILEKFAPVYDLSPEEYLGEEIGAIVAEDPDKYVVVSPDKGHEKPADRIAERYKLKTFSMIKERDRTGVHHTAEYDPDFLAGKTAIIVDDMMDECGTVVSATKGLVDAGIEEVIVVVTHPLLSGKAYDNLAKADAARIKLIIATNTVDTSEAEAKLGSRLKIKPIEPIIVQGLVPIINNQPVPPELLGNGGRV